MKTIPYGRQTISDSDIARVSGALKKDFITQGPIVAVFENLLRRYCGAKYAVAVSSGTAALHIACLAAGLPKRSEVVTTPITFVATSNAVIYSGAKPVFADIDQHTNNISPVEIEKKVTRRTAAILPVHFAGMPCDMEKIHKIAKINKLVVIEDACHALGAEYKCGGKWVKIGSCAHSDMAVFSFHPVKMVTTGEGGAVVTNSKALYEKLLALRSHGIYRDGAMSAKVGPWFYEMRDLGFNYRITDFQCALGVGQLKKIETFLDRRKEIAHMYNDKLSKLDGVILPSEEAGARSSWHLYCLKVRDAAGRKFVFEKLKDSGIGVQVHYIPVYLHAFYQKLGYRKKICPSAEDFYSREISIPIYPGMRNRDVDFVVSKIEGALS